MSLLIVPAAYLTVPDLLGVGSSRFIRLVKALAIDIVEDDRRKDRRFEMNWVLNQVTSDRVVRMQSNSRPPALFVAQLMHSVGFL